MVFAHQAEPLVIDLKNPKKPKANSMSNEQIRQEIANDPTMSEDKKGKMETEIMTRYSFSAACFAFAFVAVPLGLQARRRETTRGLVYSLLIGTGYFLITMMAEQFKPHSLAMLMLWVPSVACVMLGVFLFWRARFK